MSTSYRLNQETEKSTTQVEFIFNEKRLIGYEGEPIAAALLANGIRKIRSCDITGEGRGVYCGIGHCFECRAEVNGIPNVRTCLTPLKQGMEVFSSRPISVGRDNDES